MTLFISTFLDQKLDTTKKKKKSKLKKKSLSIIYVSDHLLSVMKGPLCLVLVAQNQLMAKASFAQTNRPHNLRN